MELAADRKARQANETEQVTEATKANNATGATTQFERAVELEMVIDGVTDDVDEILFEPADEIEHAKALLSGIDYYERLDRLEGVARARRDDILWQIEFYCQG